jgi:putative hydrolase of the HAD superfamily
MVIRGIAFDIDDTLYLERDYVRSGFAEVARIAGRSHEEVRRLTAWLDDAFEAGVRGDTFDRLLAAFPSVAQRFDTPALVDAYRRHRPDITLLAGTTETLTELGRRGIRLAVVSDGPLPSQAAKAGALGLDRWFDPIILTAALGAGHAKPGVAAFESIERAWGLVGPRLCYIGDNPEKDFGGPRRLGWRTVRLRQPGQLRWATDAPDGEAADHEIAAPADLLALLG